MKFLITAFLFLAWTFSVQAKFLQTQDEFGQEKSLQEYFAANPNNRNKSIIYVFYNNNGCYECPQAMAMLEQIYQAQYADLYGFFMIDYQNDEEYDFISRYQLSQPLEVVLLRIQDGAVFGYQKIENLQNMTSDTVSFKNYVTEQINSFFGHNG